MVCVQVPHEAGDPRDGAAGRSLCCVESGLSRSQLSCDPENKKKKIFVFGPHL